MYAKIFHVSIKDLRICAKIQRWKTLLSEIIIRNFCACTQKSSTSLLRICVYAQKSNKLLIIKSSNNPIVDVLRPAQTLQSRVQQCERFQALVVLMSGFTHYE